MKCSQDSDCCIDFIIKHKEKILWDEIPHNLAKNLELSIHFSTVSAILFRQARRMMKKRVGL
jgi:hypothetical protein